MNVKIKICGMRDMGNVSEVARLKPDYMGFILYRHSPRFIEPEAAEKLKHLIPDAVTRVGVIVNEPFENAARLAGKFDALQLHGNEDADYCRRLSRFSKIIKAFRIDGSLPADIADYQPYCSLFLFDAAGDHFGGNGIKFNHRILDDYNLDKRFILSGGISTDDLTAIREIKNKKFEGIDLNSRFETMPGMKDAEQLKKFMKKIREQ
ncbi:MAG TPA: phosphoribosylanthranilate isomerase [Bacteroidales bacterium]|nr:phosphoribosylanthranilate isomerase [Bacteroidales bacterium]